jgi:hypothetical protein
MRERNQRRERKSLQTYPSVSFLKSRVFWADTKAKSDHFHLNLNQGG